MKAWGGNCGDALIWLGTEQLLSNLGIQTTLDPAQADVVLIPGGNQTMYQANINVWKAVWAKWPDKEFVVGPMTAYFDWTTWVEDVRHTPVAITGLFARDPISYANLCECDFGSDMVQGLSHDPALYLRDSDFIRRQKEATSEEHILAVFRADSEGYCISGQGLQWLFRSMPEALARRMDFRLKARSQASKIATAARISTADDDLEVCDISRHPLPFFFEMLRAAKAVHTDRLHCMLAAAMLGKRIFAYPTTYGKLEAVYEHSVKDWASVEFVD
ncbi:MAG: polysaccharide pyruvyl transferase family protein [Planctomycetota bacterium]|jgi:exopolysaccharide biosynthesis predicted pyruvyltransferase EpsI